MRLILRGALIALLALGALYAGDYLSARYRIPGNRQTLGSVQIETAYAVRLKNGRIEYSLGDSYTQTCIRSLFPQLGYTPCWYLSRHAKKTIEISSAAHVSGRLCLASYGPGSEGGLIASPRPLLRAPQLP